MALIFERIQTDGIAELSYLVGDDSEGVAACLIHVRTWTATSNSPARSRFRSRTFLKPTSMLIWSAARANCVRGSGQRKYFVSHEGGARYGFDHEKIVTETRSSSAPF
jgi:hydroxyacylglutathione hydrolase